MLLVVVVVVVVVVACGLWRGGCNSVIGCSVRSAPHLAAPLSQSGLASGARAVVTAFAASQGAMLCGHASFPERQVRQKQPV